MTDHTLKHNLFGIKSVQESICKGKRYTSFVRFLPKLNFQQCLQDRRLIKDRLGSGESSGELFKKIIGVNGICNLSMLLLMIFLSIWFVQESMCSLNVIFARDRLCFVLFTTSGTLSEELLAYKCLFSVHPHHPTPYIQCSWVISEQCFHPPLVLGALLLGGQYYWAIGKRCQIKSN